MNKKSTKTIIQNMREEQFKMIKKKIQKNIYKKQLEK